MTENGYPDYVLVDRAPRIFALSPDDGNGVSAWVMVLPGGLALVVEPGGEVVAQTSVDQLSNRWARRANARLVLVAEDPNRQAA